MNARCAGRDSNQRFHNPGAVAGRRAWQRDSVSALAPYQLSQVVSPGKVTPAAFSQPWCVRRLVMLNVAPVSVIRPSARVRASSSSVA